GGQSWQNPVHLHTGSTDDKQWITSDMNPSSPFYGRVYAVWGANQPVGFSRSSDQGATWKGAGASASGSPITNESSFAPALCVSDNGTLHVSWHIPGSTEIRYTRSTDGGETFEPIKSVVTGITSLTSALPNTHGWPHFPNATFRVMTLMTSCAASGGRIVL